MAVIGRIRQHTGILIGLIGISIVGFLIMDATNSQGSLLRGGNRDTVGEVNGEKIGIQEFEKKYDENIKSQEAQMQGQALTDDMRNYMRGMTWDQMVNKAIFDDVYQNLGVNVTAAEMSELATGENVHPYIRQNFSNQQTGQFDPHQVRLFLDNLDNDDPNTEKGTRRKQWLRFEEGIKQDQFQKKYENLIAKAIYVPTWQAEMMYNDQNRLVDFKYVALPYTDVNDADVKVSDDDLKKYLDAHAAAYKSDEETRKVQYVTFDISASSGDSAATVRALEEKREEFAKNTTVSEDSTFVRIYSETAFDDVYYDKDKMTSPVKDSFFALPVKSIVGPYVDGNQFKLAKISDRKMISDSLHLREIVISFAGITTQEQAVPKFKLIDSIIRELDTLKGNFTLFAFNFSSDEVSKSRGGDLGWVKQGEKEKGYNDLLFYRAQKGKTYRIPSTTENAIHLVQIVEDKPSKAGVLVTYLSREIIPSPETERNIYSTATTFASDNQSTAKFTAAAQKLGGKTVGDLKKDAFTVTGLGTARELVKWAFKAKKGDVSNIFTFDKKHVLALLEDVQPKGVASLDAVRDKIKPLVVKEKKVELLTKKIEDAKASSVDELAAKLGRVAIPVEKSSFGNPSIGGAYEAKVVAVALNTGVGKVSKPIDGGAGVYVVQTSAIVEPAKTTDYGMYAMQLKQQLQGLPRNAAEVQKKLAKIDDNRSDFF